MAETPNMKAIFTCMALAMVALATAQEQEVKQAVTDFFVAFHAKDTVAMRRAFHKDLALQSISETPKGPVITTETAKEMLAAIAGIPEGLVFEERLLAWKIDIDGSLAHAWVTYEFYVNGKRSHGGVDSFTLVREGTSGGWKILHLADTRRK